MQSNDIYQFFSETIWAIIIASGPVMALALVIGLTISFFQALTQIQEMTLTFVPKIVAIFLGLIASAPLMYQTLSKLSQAIFERIGSGAI